MRRGGGGKYRQAAEPVKSHLGCPDRQYFVGRFTNLNLNTWLRNGLQKRDIDVGVALHPDHYVQVQVNRVTAWAGQPFSNLPLPRLLA